MTSNSLLASLAKLAAPCYSCGTCSAVCPWGLVREKTGPIRKMMRKVQLGLAPANGEMWLCAACKACEAQCPRGVPISQVIRGLREISWNENKLPRGLSSVAWSLYFGGNPWSRPPSERMAWAKGLNIKTYEKGNDVLLYIGCAVSYDKRSQKIAKAVLRLLNEAGINFGVLGDKEPCCGEGMLALGQRAYAQDIIAANTRLFSELEVKNVVAISPHCFDMFKNHYGKGSAAPKGTAPQRGAVPPEGDLGWKALHCTEFLAGLVDQKKISWQEKVPLTVTYHDPCYLGRSNSIYEAPRKILNAIPGIELVEMKESRDRALCCGGGGGRMWMETSSEERFSNIRVTQAMATEAEVLVTSCPFCIACLEDSAKLLNLPLQVMDVAELAAHALDPRAFPRKRGDLTARQAGELEDFFLKDQTAG